MKTFCIKTLSSTVYSGRGRRSIPQWLSCWNQPEKWNSIPGLCYMNPQKQYIDNGIARVLNFSRLVPPENSCFFNWSKPFVQLETTRGCFNTCAFCVSGEEKPVRTLSIESIRERLQIIHSHGIKTYASSTGPLIIIRAVLKNYCNFSWNSTRTYAFT